MKFPRNYLLCSFFLALSFHASDARAGGWDWLASAKSASWWGWGLSESIEDLSDASLDFRLEKKIRLYCPDPLSSQQHSQLLAAFRDGALLENELLIIQHPDIAARHGIILSSEIHEDDSLTGSGQSRISLLKKELKKNKERIERLIAEFKSPKEILKTLHTLWDRRETVHTLRRADEVWEEIQNHYSKVFDRNYDWLKVKRIVAARQNTSNSISRFKVENGKADWLSAAQFVQDLGALEILWTDELLISALKNIHLRVQAGLKSDHDSLVNDPIGEFRRVYVYCGTSKDLRAWNGYIPPASVGSEVAAFAQWLARQLWLADQGELNPIVLAARASQRLISIHPFSDGNGRVTRLFVDMILRRYGIAPTILLNQGGGLAIFGRRSEFSNVSTDEALERVIEAIRSTYLMATFEAKLNFNDTKQ